MFLKWRRKLINWLAGHDIVVIINTKVYDYVLDANKELLPGSCLYRRNEIVSLEHSIQQEVKHRINLEKQGVSKQGNAFVLK